MFQAELVLIRCLLGTALVPELNPHSKNILNPEIELLLWIPDETVKNKTNRKPSQL